MHNIGTLASIDHSGPSKPHKPREDLLLILLHDSPGLRDFLAHNQIIYRADNDELVGTSWKLPDSPLSANQFRADADRSLRTGFREHHVFLFGDTAVFRNCLSFGHPQRITIKQANDFFLQWRAPKIPGQYV